jgi:hypothetical protein
MVDLFGAPAADRFAGIVEHGADQAGIAHPPWLKNVLSSAETKAWITSGGYHQSQGPPLTSEGLDRISVIASNVGWQRRLVSKQLIRAREAGREINENEAPKQDRACGTPGKAAYPFAFEPGVDALVDSLIERYEIGNL